MSRLVIDVTGEQHQQIKALAALQGKSIREFVLEKLFADDKNGQNDEQAAWDELMALLSQRIKAAESGNLSDKSLREMAEEKLKDMGAL